MGTIFIWLPTAKGEPVRSFAVFAVFADHMSGFTEPVRHYDFSGETPMLCEGRRSIQVIMRGGTQSVAMSFLAAPTAPPVIAVGTAKNLV